MNKCSPRQVCCRRPLRQAVTNRPGLGQCGRRNTQGINGRIKTPVYVDGDSEFGKSHFIAQNQLEKTVTQFENIMQVNIHGKPLYLRKIHKKAFTFAVVP